jgi:aminobenzoyl-glutamate utilization protein B
MLNKENLLRHIEARKEMLFKISDSIWDFAETRFEEYKSSEILCKVLAEEGFTIQKGLAGMETSFIASYGSGKPVIGFLGEFDALYGLSQEAGIAEKKPLVEGGKGHGCGHHALGVGALAAALAVKEYIKENQIKGTVKYFGCPGEEIGCGKAYMAREGCFDDLDAAITWHPLNTNSVMNCTSLATCAVLFKFHGTSSHAAASPHLGRSALDAVELMNIGVNFLREHVEQETRLHYAIIDTGGRNPNVVQAEASVMHEMRAPKLSQITDIYDRIVDIAKGAALMTGTKFDVVFEMAASNLLNNNVLQSLLYEKFVEVGPVPVDSKDIEFAKKIRDTLSQRQKKFDEGLAAAMFRAGSDVISQISGKEVIDIIYPYDPVEAQAMASTDVGDVSWIVPTAQITTTCYAKDTAGHSWQMVAQGKSDLCHKGLLQAGKVMALAGAELLENPHLVEKAREEFDRKRSGETYKCPIPSEVKPSPSR